MIDARRDDIIALPNGQQFNPVSFETALVNHSAVSGAMFVVGGEERDSPALLLLEPADLVADPEAFVETLWPLVETFNARAPMQAQIARSQVVATEPRGLVRAPKGSVVRKLTVERFLRGR